MTLPEFSLCLEIVMVLFDSVHLQIKRDESEKINVLSKIILILICHLDVRPRAFKETQD